MKNNLFKTTTYFLFASLFLITFSCKLNDDDNIVINADSYISLLELTEALKPDPEILTIADPTIANSITGEDGTIINIGANAFTDSNNDPVTGPVTAKLNEYLGIKDMFMGNAQTESNGQLLVTGGNFDLTFEDMDGNAVNSDPFSLQASIPVETDVAGLENDLRYYNGTRTEVDGREVVNWELNENSEVWFAEGAFNIAGLDQGLSNCDVLYDMTGDTPTQFEVTVDGVTNYSSTVVWMFIDDFPSVVMIYTLNDTDDALETYANSIPTGLNATLLAIHIDGSNYLKFGTLPITVAGDDVFNVSVDFGTTAQLSNLVSSILN